MTGLQEIDDLVSRVEKLEKILQEVFDDYDKSETEWKKSKFKERNAEALGKYADKVKAIDGTDIFEKAFDEYSNDEAFKDLSEEEYIAKLTAALDCTLSKLKEALSAEEVVAAKEADTTEVKADGEPVAEAKEVEGEAVSDDDKKEEEVLDSDLTDELAEFEAYAKEHPEEGKKYR